MLQDDYMNIFKGLMQSQNTCIIDKHFLLVWVLHDSVDIGVL